MNLHGILLSCLNWCSWLLLGIVRQVTKADMAVGPSLAASLEPLVRHRNKTSLSLFFWEILIWEICPSEPAELVPLPYSRVRSTRYSDRLYDFRNHS